MIRRYKTILQYADIENIIEKSRFIGYAKPVNNEAEAVRFIEEIKLLHKNATHNVPAYVIGDHYEIQRYSDDGEPAGTAGIPILDMLKKEEIKNTVVVVTRYFGGIKLGTGGLVRAYTNTAKLVLNEAKIIEKVLYDLIKIRIDYPMMGKLQNELLNGGFYIKDTIFDDKVNIFVYSEEQKTKAMTDIIVNLTSGKAEIQIEDTLYLNEFDGTLIKETL